MTTIGRGIVMRMDMAALVCVQVPQMLVLLKSVIKSSDDGTVILVAVRGTRVLTQRHVSTAMRFAVSSQDPTGQMPAVVQRDVSP